MELTHLNLIESSDEPARTNDDQMDLKGMRCAAIFCYAILWAGTSEHTDRLRLNYAAWSVISCSLTSLNPCDVNGGKITINVITLPFHSVSLLSWSSSPKPLNYFV